MQEMESEGKTVAEAVDAALRKMGLRRDQVEVLTLQEASGGFMGFGAKPARVKITEKRWGPQGQAPAAKRPPHTPSGRQGAPRRSGDFPPAHATPQQDRAERAPRPERSPRTQRSSRSDRSQRPPRDPRPDQAPSRRHEAPQPRGAALTGEAAEAACLKAAALIKEVLALMAFEGAAVQAVWDSEQDRIKASIETPEATRLIGPDGRVLESLQFLVTLIMGRRLGSPVAVQVDANGYWQSKEDAVLADARKGVEEVRSTGKPFRMPPMDAHMRRLIHRSLAGHPDITTISEGDGAWRKIVLRPLPAKK